MDIVRSTDKDYLGVWRNLLLASKGIRDGLYGPAGMSYYKEYCKWHKPKDLSFVVLQNSEPLCGIRMLSSNSKSQNTELSCYGLPILYVENSSLSLTDVKSLQRVLKKELDAQLNQLNENYTLRFRDNLHGGSLSPFGILLLEKGASACPNYSQIIDLSLQESDLRKDLTKTNKWAVNWGEKNLDIKVLESSSITEKDIMEFMSLHIDVAGRETRSFKSWERQYEMIVAGECFGVFAKVDKTLVSAALFPHSKAHCYYGVGVSRRELFDKPISHAVIWAAILNAKKKGIRYFEMGDQEYKMSPNPGPSQKALSLSYFKKAFGGVPHVSLDLVLCVDSKQTHVGA
tara:strand:+ start:801 stop:1832 length:1032 start_codon:yes stop_codon:yes gene_type:complete